MGHIYTYTRKNKFNSFGNNMFIFSKIKLNVAMFSIERPNIVLCQAAGLSCCFYI